jgi:hypothetical protein
MYCSGTPAIPGSKCPINQFRKPTPVQSKKRCPKADPAVANPPKRLFVVVVDDVVCCCCVVFLYSGSSVSDILCRIPPPKSKRDRRKREKGKRKRKKKISTFGWNPPRVPFWTPETPCRENAVL